MKIDHNKIESLLYEINKSEYYIMPYADQFSSNLEYKLYVNHIEIMIEEFTLINHFKTKNSTLYVTKFGRNIIVNYGGWLKFLEHEKTVQIRAESKAKYDLNVSKRLSKIGYWPFIISIIALIISIGTIIYTNLKEQQKQKLELQKTDKKIRGHIKHNLKSQIHALKKK